ncbi:hypothetical protein CN931_01355 [Bacillus sp. AFS054943]|uniref:DUF3775 domain-containing protein n=1 Tax=Bacillus TaxID=1386 RepID=UPI000BF39ABE|nr:MULTISPECIES: DUF3775 domain-containing protein [Bacillus]PER23511.1 hypothetical protein CN476_17335 [Bacillus cereus]PGL87858.1 hypothetical protein CN931_01355 [Bacillus sp. AFS054943]PGZ69609.1 hypothetical protein COE49_21435 [Bacillus sp. AFS029637]
MLEELNGVFKDVIKLARDRRVYYEQNVQEGVVYTLQEMSAFYKSSEGQELNEKKQLLKNYLEELDFDTVKTIQSIMYLGRDRDYDKQDTPEEIFYKQREDFDSQGWQSKSIEINQIVEKAPLDGYLEDGLKILQINLK